jgi:hypothetical protein
LKKITVCSAFGFLVLGHATTAQIGFADTNNGRTMEMRDLNGNSLLNDKYQPDIEGTPFLIKDWKIATLVTKKGVQVNNVSVKLNIESNELYYLDSAGKTWIANAGNVVKISLINFDGKDNTTTVFKCGYPAIGKQTNNYYYQVLADGKIALLKKLYKTIETFKNDLSGEKRREFVEGTRIFVFVAGEIKEVKNDKGFILDLMNDKQAAIEKYLDLNKINFKKTADLEKLIGYYNGL